LLAIELILHSEDRHKLTEAPLRPAIAAWLTQLRKLPGLTSAVSVFDALSLTSADNLPDDIRKSLLNEQATEARITLRFKNSAGFHYQETLAQIKEIGQHRQPAGVSVRVTGLVPLLLDAQNNLLKVQARVFFLSMGLLTGLIALIFRSVKILVCALAANFIPLLLTAGIMALLNIPINSFNIFVAAVMLGVIVDDTIHLLYAYRQTGDMEAALAEINGALWATTMTVLLAFATLLVSEFVPIVQFGLLVEVAVVSAYLCDVYLLPHLMQGTVKAS